MTKKEMGRVRPFFKHDIPQIASLYQTVFGSSNSSASQTLRVYLEQIFFNNPWYDEDLPSLVMQDNAGKILGFLGVIPRRMLLNSRPIRVAVSTSFMVEPQARFTPSAVQLLKTFLSGPQDLSLTDASNDLSRKLWERLGGTTALLYSLSWTRPLKPTGYLMNLVARKRRGLRALVFVSKPIGAVVDAFAARMPPNCFPQLGPPHSKEDADVETLLECLSSSGTQSLQPHYNSWELKWLLEMAAEKKQHGTLRKAVLRNNVGEIIGWYLYYLKPGGISQVLQVGTRSNSIQAVLNDLFYHAWRHGSIAISGRLDPRFLQELSENYCLFSPGTWTLIHSNNPELSQAIYRGDAFLSRLEGEWWTRFLECISGALD